MNLGMVAQGRGNLDEAETRLETARDQFEAIGDTDGVMKSLANLGRIYLDQGSLDEAEANYLEAQQLARNIGDEHSLARIVDFLGEVAWHRDDHMTACDHFETALELFLELDIPRDAGPCLRSLFVCYHALLPDHDQRVRDGLDELVEMCERTKTGELRDGMVELRDFARQADPPELERRLADEID